MSQINVNLKELKEDIRTLIRQGLSFISTCISGMYGITLPTNKNHADEISNIKESLMNLKNSINESNIIIADVVKFFNDIETKNEKLLNYLDKKYNVKEIETEEEKVTDNIEDKEDVLTSTETTEKEHTEESADLESVTTEIEESDTVDSSVESVKVENSEAENVIAEIEESNEVNEQTSTEVVKNETGALEVDRVNTVVSNVVNVNDVEKETQAVESESWFTKIKEKFQKITEKLRGMWKNFKKNWLGISENILLPKWEETDENVKIMTEQIESLEEDIKYWQGMVKGYQANLDSASDLAYYDPYSEQNDEHDISWLIDQIAGASIDSYETDSDYIARNKVLLSEAQAVLDTKIKEYNELLAIRTNYVHCLNDAFYSQFYAADDFAALSQNVENVEYCDEYVDAVLYLDDDQKDMYVYLYNKEGADAAEEYFNTQKSVINYRKGLEQALEFLKGYLVFDENGNPVLDENGKVVISDEKNFIDSIGVAIKGFYDGEENFKHGIEYEIQGLLGQMDNVLSADQYEQMFLLQFLTNGDSVVYELSTSIGNMAIPVALSVAVSYYFPNASQAIISAISSGAMGFSSAGNTWKQTYSEKVFESDGQYFYQNGSSYTDAAFYGTLVGVSEATLQYALGGIDGLSKVNGAKGFFAKMLDEGKEEAVQAVLDSYFRSVALGEPFELNIDDILKSGAYGIITAGIMNGGAVTFNIAGEVASLNIDITKITDKNYQNALMEVLNYKYGKVSLTYDSLSEEAKGILDNLYIKKNTDTDSRANNRFDSSNAIEVNYTEVTPNLGLEQFNENVEIEHVENVTSENIDTSDAGIKKATEAFEINQEVIEEEIVVPEFEPMPTIDTSSNVSLPSNDDIYNPAEIQKGWEELIGNFGEKIRNTSSESFNDNVILPLTEMFEKTKNLFEIKTQEETEIPVPNFPSAPTIDTISNASLSFSNEIYNSDEIQDGWKKILDSLASEKQVSSDSFQQDVIDPLIELVEKTKNIFDVNDNLYEESEVSIPIFEKMPTFDVAASALALSNIGNVIDTFNSGSTFDSVDYNDSHDAVIPEDDVSELIAEKKFLDEIEAIMNSEEVSDSEAYAEFEQIRDELNREAEQRRQQLEEENKQKIFEEINEVLEESDSFKPSYNTLNSDLIKQMLKTRIKGILSNNNLTVRTRINDVINILKNFRKVYTKGSFNNETGSTLESLFFDPNIAIGIHRAGLIDGQLIVDEGLKLTGDMSSGSFDINQTLLSKNISFFSQNNLISYLGFLNSINTAHNYKTYGADNADVVIFAFPKDAIIDYEKANLTKYPDLVIQDGNGNYVVNPKYILGYVNDKNGVVSDITLNRNYSVDSSGDVYITPRTDIEVLDDVSSGSDSKFNILELIDFQQSDFNAELNLLKSAKEIINKGKKFIALRKFLKSLRGPTKIQYLESNLILIENSLERRAISLVAEKMHKKDLIKIFPYLFSKQKMLMLETGVFTIEEMQNLISHMSQSEIDYLNDNLEVALKIKLIDNGNTNLKIVENFSGIKPLGNYPSSDYSKVKRLTEFAEGEMLERFDRFFFMLDSTRLEALIKSHHYWNESRFYREMRIPNVAAFNCESGSYYNIMYDYEQLLNNFVHENVHEIVRKGKITGFRTEKKYVGINEAVTEYFTELILGEYYPKYSSCGYRVGVEKLKLMIDYGIFNFEELRSAYQYSISSYFNKIFNKQELEIFLDLFNKVTRGDMSAADKLDQFIVDYALNHNL